MSFLDLLSPPDSFDARPAVAALVAMALEERASDLHLRPVEGRVQVLIRRDGVLSPAEQPGGRGAPIAREQHRARLADAFRRQDANHDGFLVAKELAAPPR